jgi:hypothetical protein
MQGPRSLAHARLHRHTEVPPQATQHRPRSPPAEPSHTRAHACCTVWVGVRQPGVRRRCGATHEGPVTPSRDVSSCVFGFWASVAVARKQAQEATESLPRWQVKKEQKVRPTCIVETEFPLTRARAPSPSPLPPPTPSPSSRCPLIPPPPPPRAGPPLSRSRSRSRAPNLQTRSA